MKKIIERSKDFNEMFSTEKQCLDYLYSLRWPDGYRCPRCYHNEAWQIKEWKYKCRKCGYQVTVTAGTIFQDTHLPLMLWFKAIWYVCLQTGGVNALDLQKELGLGSYRTAWTMLLKIRKLMADNEPIKLGGKVAVEKCSIYRTRRAKRADIFIATEICANRRIGNICMDSDCDQSHDEFSDFLCKHIKAGSIVISPSSGNYWDCISKDYKFEIMHRTQNEGQWRMPITHSVVKWLENRGLLDNQQLRSSREHLQSYLTECCYKFNRRNKTAAELFEEILCGAVCTDPITYGQFLKNK